MAITLVPGAHTTGFGQNSTGGMTINSSSANLLIAAGAWYAGVTTDPTITDGNLNTYSLGTKQTTATPTSVRIVYSNSATPGVGVGHAFTLTCVTGFIAGSFSAWAGANAGSSVLDQENGKTGSGISLTLDPITPSENNCLIVTALMFEDNSSGAVSISGGGFTLLDTVVWNGATNEGLAVAYVVQTTAQVVAPQWIVTNSAPVAAAMAVFKGPGGGGVAESLMGQVMM